jgi:hypothetical protein
MNTIQNFKPVVIGVNWQKKNEALNAWRNVIDISCDVLSDMASFLDAETIETDQFLELAAMKPKECLIKLFELSGGTIPGMNTKKAIELGLIENEYAKELEKNIIRFQQAKAEAESRFKYDMRLLRNQDKVLFDLTPEFDEALQTYCTIYTKSASQNEALEKLKSLTDALNYFADSGLISKSYGTKGIDPVLHGIKFNNGMFVPELNLFSRQRWNVIFI